ncbi:LPS export ABC transporter permease LptG [Bisgaard Taxon 10/6]|uniref:LPS export ABC transporter permease LptG n=1 Tax=Exercitatus varius TaxID=67857 RepID=A0AAW6QDI1_9PAST|nr:LPS export ABC transporter permease LptG [Exercitatus varius]MDG2917384.1 LPS export ABC transporter permease LptG [Exercitatus varius]MDG2942319.1 LPS export ABC transporter permease LptG [Exercitatus varius]MDG2944376.1 LPS export ABC transporter permease LptG [Exercitatus varius]MDG2948860.1 LPS export ABC transporter permease LptG [Exercitatus varius]MDG2950255.1 LPS export ABC transporter permease LptG [Exercitatus varius]
MNTLERYIGKSILGTIFATLLTLVGLSAIIKFVEQFRSVGKGTYDSLQAVLFTVLTIPKDVETFFPMAALLGALIALGNLASRSELIVMQSAGFSRLKIGIAVMKTAIPLVLITMVIGEWGIPQTEQYARDMRAKAISGGSLMSVKNSVWAKDGNDFIFVRQVREDANLKDVYIYHFDNRQLQRLSHANSATYENGKWQLQQLNVSDIKPDQISTKNYISQEWQTSLTPDKLGIVSLRPTSLSISGLSEYIAFLHQTGQDSKKFELTYWRKLFQPISVGVMMMLALSFIFGPLRSVTAGARIVTGICFGFLFYVINEIFGPLSLVYNVAPIAGALMPSVLFLIITWWLLSRKRD